MGLGKEQIYMHRGGAWAHALTLAPYSTTVYHGPAFTCRFGLEAIDAVSSLSKHKHTPCPSVWL